MPARTVADDGELKLLGAELKTQMADRIATFLLKEEVGHGSIAGEHHRPTQDHRRRYAKHQTLHLIFLARSNAIIVPAPATMATRKLSRTILVPWHVQPVVPPKNTCF